MSGFKSGSTNRGLKSRLTEGWGKVRRFYYGFFRPHYVQKSLERRQGECIRCGICCGLMISCPLLKKEGHLTLCSCHSVKPRNCRIFPVDERDLSDRDLIAPDLPCGYRFNGKR